MTPKYRSLKPGRGPSFMGGIGSVIAVIFGIFWTAMASEMSAGMPFGMGSIFPLFGILFIVMGVATAIYHFKNATSPDRYSMIDITDSESEPDPLNELYGRKKDPHSASEGPGDVAGQVGSDSVPAKSGEERAGEQSKAKTFCPYCGEGVAENYRFCPSCGKDLLG